MIAEAGQLQIPQWAVVIFSLIGGQAILLGLFHFGIKTFQRWFMDAVINPHVKPMQEDLRTIKIDYAATRALVATHDAVLNEHDKHIAMLQGRVFGNIPVMNKRGDEEPIDG